MIAGWDALQVPDPRGPRRIPGDRLERARADRGAGGPGDHAPLPRQHGDVPGHAPGLTSEKRATLEKPGNPGSSMTICTLY